MGASSTPPTLARRPSLKPRVVKIVRGVAAASTGPTKGSQPGKTRSLLVNRMVSASVTSSWGPAASVTVAPWACSVPSMVAAALSRQRAFVAVVKRRCTRSVAGKRRWKK